eukprot:GFKZ01014503.1.p3 GENE.GFKZ01014503.1~~GFKZ01014503.1.p3  ORF type:complete len:166 (+),score=21.17 GFKZ01014503.1:970-1467(+)
MEGTADSEGVIEAAGVIDMEGPADSKGVVEAAGVTDSEGVIEAAGVIDMEGPADSKGVVEAAGVIDMEGTAESEGVTEAVGVAGEDGGAVGGSLGHRNSKVGMTALQNRLLLLRDLPQGSTPAKAVFRRPRRHFREALMKKTMGPQQLSLRLKKLAGQDNWNVSS